MKERDVEPNGDEAKNTRHPPYLVNVMSEEIHMNTIMLT
jgi:hypothetical protein